MLWDKPHHPSASRDPPVEGNVALRASPPVEGILRFARPLLWRGICAVYMRLLGVLFADIIIRELLCLK